MLLSNVVVTPGNPFKCISVFQSASSVHWKVLPDTILGSTTEVQGPKLPLVPTEPPG